MFFTPSANHKCGRGRNIILACVLIPFPLKILIHFLNKNGNLITAIKTLLSENEIDGEGFLLMGEEQIKRLGQTLAPKQSFYKYTALYILLKKVTL